MIESRRDPTSLANDKIYRFLHQKQNLEKEEESLSQELGKASKKEMRLRNGRGLLHPLGIILSRIWCGEILGMVNSGGVLSLAGNKVLVGFESLGTWQK
ncbi:hypothetical protein Tco_0425927 [Tanacetum coccineum]